MFFSNSVNSSSSSDCEGEWPPPGRRRRHPAGNINVPSEESEGFLSSFSDRLDSPSYLLTNDGRGQQTSVFFMAKHDCQGGGWSQDYRSTAPSSGFYSHKPTQSIEGLHCITSLPYVNPLNNEQDQRSITEDDLMPRFENFRLDADNDSKFDLPDPAYPTATPPMLRRFLNAQNPEKDELSHSYPSARVVMKSNFSKT